MTRSPSRRTIPLYACGVSAGFPSPAEDDLACRLDLNRWLIAHPAATFCVRVEGDSMTGAHIYDGDVLVVDRMLEADDGDIIVARVGAEMCVKRLHIIDGEVWLYPESDNTIFLPLRITEEIDFCVGKGAACHSFLDAEEAHGLAAGETLKRWVPSP